MNDEFNEVISHYEEYDRLVDEYDRIRDEIFSSQGIPPAILNSPTMQEALHWAELMHQHNQRIRTTIEEYIGEFFNFDQCNKHKHKPEPVNWKRDGF